MTRPRQELELPAARSAALAPAARFERHRLQQHRLQQHRLQQHRFEQHAASSSSSSTEVVIEPLNSFVVDADATTAQIGAAAARRAGRHHPDGEHDCVRGRLQHQPAGSTTSGVTTFPVTISVTGSSYGIYPGASADVEIVMSQVNNVLVVPTTAVHTVGTTSFVDLLKNGKEVEQPVTAGASGGAYTQVMSGLKSGQEVVIASLSRRIPSSTSGAHDRGLGGRRPGRRRLRRRRLRRRRRLLHPWRRRRLGGER